ncbi:hypothetical protein AF78_04275 [Aliarcobacter butzleri L353]|uniref:hypothetical protein n=1 Tax=Aliarcobacter butzleri TaxID=28197 RepID=UPI000659066A|nr:hypothetical protein [Aliarcobacter butzleri]KLE05989.1 hypothetical protein AF78_04275 [Aliarcobacter butzleri L353]
MENNKDYNNERLKLENEKLRLENENLKLYKTALNKPYNTSTHTERYTEYTKYKPESGNIFDNIISTVLSIMAAGCAVVAILYFLSIFTK